MAKSETKIGRPRKEIDKAQFEELCVNHFSKDAIARFFSVDIKTLQRWCKRTYLIPLSTFVDKKRAEGNNALLSLALAQAEKVPSVLIFLLKNWCKYSDNPKDETSKNTGFGGDLLKWFDSTKIQTDATHSANEFDNRNDDAINGEVQSDV